MLGSFITAHRAQIMARCQGTVATQSPLVSIEAESDHGVHVFLDQLVDGLRLGASTNDDIGRSALRHGRDLLVRGFTVSQVVHTYGDVRQAITELALKMNASISAVDLQTLNRCFDEAIAAAVTEYGRERDQSTANAATARAGEHLGYFTHELRNLVNTALLAFEMLETRNVGISGSIGSVLGRSLLGLRSLVGRSVAEVRLTRGVIARELILLSGFIAEISASASLQAQAKGVRLTVLPCEEGVAIEGDRQVLAAVLENLLQNAFKFTRPHTVVTLRASASGERVLLDIEDECGGLPGGNGDDLFRPFEQRSDDRTGMGLGLAFSRWAVGAHHGRIYARNLPGRGCVFTVELPRFAIVTL